MNQIIKLGVGIVLAGLLTACGPDGDSGGEEKGILSKGGECVDIGHSADTKGVFTRDRVIIPGAPESFIEQKILENDGKVLKNWARVYYANQNIDNTTITKVKYYKKNNYIHLTDSNMTMTQAGIKATIHITFDPYGHRIPDTKVCKGQSWVDAFTSKIVTYPRGESKKSSSHFIFGIEDINVEKTVVAGDFDTYILTHYADKDKKIIMKRDWIDIKSGVTVYTEHYEAGQVTYIAELIEFKK